MFGKKDEKVPDVEFFTVFDSKSRTYREPFPAPNKDVVLRDFMNAFRSPDAAQKNVYYKNAEDYAIFKVGNFDLREGKLMGFNAEHICNLHDLRAMCQPPAQDPGALLPT